MDEGNRSLTHERRESRGMAWSSPLRSAFSRYYSAVRNLSKYSKVTHLLQSTCLPCQYMKYKIFTPNILHCATCHEPIQPNVSTLSRLFNDFYYLCTVLQQYCFNHGVIFRMRLNKSLPWKCLKIRNRVYLSSLSTAQIRQQNGNAERDDI